MNVASLELCKELYEVSEWGRVGELENKPSYMPSYRWQPFIPREGSMIAKPIDEFNYQMLPAYDLGYLLRKLPPELGEESESNVLIVGTKFADYIELNNDGVPYRYNGNVLSQVADTPEDALCQLAIKLFQEGVLKK